MKQEETGRNEKKKTGRIGKKQEETEETEKNRKKNKKTGRNRKNVKKQHIPAYFSLFQLIQAYFQPMAAYCRLFL